MRAKLLLPVTLVAATLAACGAGDNYSTCNLGPAQAGSCTNVNNIGPGTCTDVAGISATELAAFQAACTAGGDTWAATPCPTAGRVGSCASNGGISTFSGFPDARGNPTAPIPSVASTCWRAYIRYYASTAATCTKDSDCGGNAACTGGTACTYTTASASADCDPINGNEFGPNVFIPN